MPRYRKRPRALRPECRDGRPRTDFVGLVGGRRASGIEVSGLARGGFWTVRDGKVTRVVWFNTPEEAFAAAGVSVENADAEPG
jgi:hypothetical protein